MLVEVGDTGFAHTPQSTIVPLSKINQSKTLENIHSRNFRKTVGMALLKKALNVASVQRELY